MLPKILNLRCKYCATKIIKGQTMCLSCQMKRDFVHIAADAGLEGLKRRMFVLYMNQRFALSVIGEQYAKEWAERFKKGTEYAEADNEGRVVLDSLIKAFHL